MERATETGGHEYFRKTGASPGLVRALPRTSRPGAQLFGNAVLGLFVLWGIELSWGMVDIGADVYLELARRFDPRRYEPERWLAAAAAAGFRYAVLTARHHDGYALWPSAAGFPVRSAPRYRSRCSVRWMTSSCMLRFRWTK